MESSRRFFVMGCAVEGGLFLAGALLCGLFGAGFGSNFHWNVRDGLMGLAATVPLVGLFVWACHSPWKPLHEIRLFLDQMVVPLIRPWSTSQVLAISILAGLGEEFLFRGAIQGGLSILVDPVPGLILASVIFGLFHPVTWTYLILASFMGGYLGVLWLWADNLLVPVLVHAVYDFLALSYLLRQWKGPQGADADNGG